VSEWLASFEASMTVQRVVNTNSSPNSATITTNTFVDLCAHRRNLCAEGVDEITVGY
jgi:hypothetical protein